ncbi:MAG: CoA-binding protein [Desulfitobacteriaceae bacterium]
MREKVIYPFSEDLHTGLSYAVLGNAEKFVKHKHAWKVWRALKEFGCTVYPVAKDLPRWAEAKVFSDLSLLTGKVNVVVSCLRPEEVPSLVEEAQAAKVELIWFQEQTWSPLFQEQCEGTSIKTLRGCVLRHKKYRKPLSYFHPCYWHGLRDLKVPRKRHL